MGIYFFQFVLGNKIYAQNKLKTEDRGQQQKIQNFNFNFFSH